MHLISLIFGTVLLSKAYSLNCYECPLGASGSCTQRVCLSQSYQCSAMRVVSYAGGSKVADIDGKFCALAEECFTGSVNYGAARTVFTSKCCTSDLCNTQPAPDPTTSSPNGKKCFTCNGQTCDATLNCETNEDYCISTTVAAGGEKMKLKGCASGLVCSNSQSTQISGAIGGEINCCQGDYCNGASSTSAGLLLIVAPLIYFIVFS